MDREGKIHKRLSLIIINKSGLLKTDHERFILLKTYYVFNSLNLILLCLLSFDYEIPLTCRVYHLIIGIYFRESICIFERNVIEVSM